MPSLASGSLSEQLNETVGAMLISAIIGSVLQGVTTCQTITYFLRSKSDSRVIRSLVLFVWVINVLHAFLVIDSVYTYSVTHHGDPSALATLTWSSMAIIVGNVVGDLGVKGIFSYRIWKISRQWYLGVLIMLTAVITFTFAVFVVTEMALSPTSPPEPVGTYGSLASLAGSDIVMSIVLTSVLYQHRSVFPNVNQVLRRVIWYSAETSVVTSLGAVIGLILYAALPTKPVLFMAVLWILPYLISSSVLVALNARKDLRRRTNLVASVEMRGRLRGFDCDTALSYGDD